MDEKQIRDEFKLRLSGVEDGTRCFSIHCEKAFFELAEISEKLVNVLCQFNGYVVAPCDRCLLPVRLPMDFEQRLIVKLVPNIGEEPESEDDDIWVLDENTYELDLFQFVYESIFLALPIRIVHEDDENGNSTCDPQVLAKLEELSQKEEEKESDPRWDALKNLKLD